MLSIGPISALWGTTVQIILGFGSTEEGFVRAEEKAIGDHIKARFAELGLSYFTDEFTRDIAGWVKDRGAALRAESARYKTAETYPDRYSDYHASVFGDASNIAVVLHCFHTNRRHAMSPDGWAAFTERAVFLFDTHEVSAEAEAA